LIGEASDAVGSLLRLAPEQCSILVTGCDGAIERKRIAAKFLQVGDVVEVKVGDRVPCDGTVLPGGHALLDQSQVTSYIYIYILYTYIHTYVYTYICTYIYMNIHTHQVTGESAPVRKVVGDLVISGSIVRDEILIFEATRVGKDAFLNQLVLLVERTQASKAPIQLVADRISAVFVPAIILLSILTFVVWYACFILHLVPKDCPGREHAFMSSFLFANAVVVVACPCALGLATPTAVMVGSGVGARLGILIKSGAALEVAHKVTAVVLDKTGTLTEGNMSVVKSIFFPKALSAAGGGEGGGEGGAEAEVEVLEMVSWIEQVCMYVYICMYVYTYVHTYYVLTNPPIPSSRCKCFVVLRPV